MAGKVSSDPNVFLLPDLGEGLEEAELIEWMVKPGQTISEFDILAKVETDKALAEVPADRAGTIAELHGSPGEKIKVHAPFVTFKGASGGAGAAKALTKTNPDSANQKALQRTVDQNAPAAAESKKEEEREDAGTVVGTMQAGGMFEAAPGKVIATPAVRRMARDMNVDLAQVNGTGIGGRVTERDVQAFASSGNGSATIARNGASARVEQEPPPAARPPMRPRAGAESEVAARPRETSSSSASSSSTASARPGESVRIPFRGVRRTIAERLRESVNFAVHFNVMDDADVSKLDELRRRLAAASGEKVSFLPFVCAAVCRVLSGRSGNQFTKLNSTVDDKAQEIIQHRSVHLGVATDTDNGLMVPVIKDADNLGVLEIQRRINALAKSARDRSIPRDHLTGGTFTVSNVGSLAGRYATPIINYPECGILAVGRADSVVVRNGMIGIGKLLPLSLACDHRVVDGSTAAMALARIIELLQSPDELLPTK